MPNEPLWLEPEEIETINRREVEATNEPYLVLNRNLLESAAGKPKNRWFYGDEMDSVRLAVALMHGIARNHCFEQGNKRTAATAALLFLDYNGYEWVKEDTEEFGVMVERLINNEISENELAEWMRSYLLPY